MADRETELRERLLDLRRRYQDEARPIVEELTKIEAAKAPSPMIYLSQQMGQTLAASVSEAKMRALFPNGHPITRRWTDEEGNLVTQPVPPTEFYAQPERKCFVCGAVGDADHLGFCSESW